MSSEEGWQVDDAYLGGENAVVASLVVTRTTVAGRGQQSRVE